MKEILGKEDLRKIEDTLMSTYGAHLGNERFIVRVFGQSDSVLLRVQLDQFDGMSRHTFEINAPSKSNGLKLDQALDLALDFLGYYLDQFFEDNRELLLPLDYQEYEFGEHKVFARGDYTRPKLDELADRILREGKIVDPNDPDFRDLK